MTSVRQHCRRPRHTKEGGHQHELALEQDTRTATRVGSRNGAVSSAPKAWSLPATSRQSISVSPQSESSLRAVGALSPLFESL